ncbi:neutral zinc metallopeptidase [Nocardioides caeni]|uniref:KPN_02809 family neutral zinc metallopeptidase n=1 Tax=Nocardioides caeni TaxID=574700 RepID=UPI0031E9E3EC
MVRFNPKARLDRSRVKDTGRGGGGGGGGLGGGGVRLPIPVGKGGIGGLVVIVLLVVLAQCTGLDLLGGGGSGGSGGANRLSNLTDRYAECETGADANDSQDCARLAIENSITGYWQGAYGELSGYDGGRARGFQPIDSLYTFTGSVDTGCGSASSAVGPFYCPADESIYLDTTFFDDVLERQLGGPDGGFVEFYVLAHEYGHHISNLIGSMGLVTSQETGPQSQGVRLELQADCFAGMWAAHAEQTEDVDGNVLIEDITDEDIELAIDAAEAVGDDRIQEQTQGQATPETWTHGSADQRRYWFDQGYRGRTCDTFAARSVQVP